MGLGKPAHHQHQQPRCRASSVHTSWRLASHPHPPRAHPHRPPPPLAPFGPRRLPPRTARPPPKRRPLLPRPQVPQACDPPLPGRRASLGVPPQGGPAPPSAEVCLYSGGITDQDRAAIASAKVWREAGGGGEDGGQQPAVHPSHGRRRRCQQVAAPVDEGGGGGGGGGAGGGREDGGGGEGRVCS